MQIKEDTTYIPEYVEPLFSLPHYITAANEMGTKMFFAVSSLFSIGFILNSKNTVKNDKFPYLTVQIYKKIR